MAAAFRPLDTNVAVISMGGSTTVDLCKLNVENGLVTSTLLPSSWTSQISDNLVKLLPITELSERRAPEFVRMLLAVVDTSGLPTAHVLTEDDGPKHVRVVVETAGANDVVLLHTPRTTDAGYLIPSGPGGGDGGVDTFARSRITELQADKAERGELAGFATSAQLALKADAAALELKADKSYVDNNYALQSSVAGKADKTYVDDTFATKSALADKADAASVFDYVAATDGGLQRASASPGQREFSVDATIPRLATAVSAADFNAGLTEALVLDNSGKFGLVAVASAADVAGKADASSVKAYDALSGGGLVMPTTGADAYKFSAAADVVRVSTPPSAADAGKSPVARADGKFDLVEFATVSALEAVVEGLKYRDAVKKTYATVPSKATLTADGLVNDDRFLVNASPATSSNGVYVVTGTGSTRAADFANGTAVSGTYVFDINPTTGGAAYVCTNVAPSDVVNTDALTFSVYAVGKTYTAANSGGLVLSGTAFSADLAQAATAGDAPTMNSGTTGTVGTSSRVARADHKHPVDTALMPKAGGEFTGVPTLTTALSDGLATSEPAAGSNKLATTKYVKSMIGAVTSGISDVTIASSSANYATRTTTAGVVSISLSVGVPTGLATHADTRFNPAPLVIDKGKIAYINAAGAWATLGVGSSTNNTLTWDTTNGVPVWGPGSGGLPTTAPKGQLLYTSALGAWTGLAAGTAAGQALKWDITNGVPVWGALTAADVGAAPTTGAELSAPTRATELTTVTTGKELVTANWVKANVPYDIAGSTFGKLPQSDKVFLYVAPRAIKLDNTADSARFRVLVPVPSSGSATALRLYHMVTGATAPTELGVVTFSPGGGEVGSYVPSVAGPVAIAKGEYVYLATGAAVDLTIATLFFTLGGTVS